MTNWLAILAIYGLFGIWGASDAQAGPFDRLQVLLPGETAAPGTPAGKTGTPDAQIVGVPFAVQMRACDANWNLVTSISDVVAWHATDVSATLPASVALLAGQMSATVTLNAAGTFTISGQDLGNAGIPEGFSAGVVTVVLGGFEFAAITPRDQVAGQPVNVIITAVDPAGNPVGGYSGPVNLQQLTSLGQGRLSPAVVDLNGGVWSGPVTMYLADETNATRGNVNLYAFLPTDTALNGVSNYFRVLPGALKRIQVILPGQTAQPGTIGGLTGTAASQAAMQTFSASLLSTDDYWNPVPSGDVVRVVSSDPGFVSPGTVSLIGGHASISLHFTTAGAQTLTASDISNGTVRAMTTVPVVVLPNYADHFEFDPLPASVVAGVSVVVLVRAVDAGGNTMLNFNGDAVLSASTGPGTISVETMTFVDGQWGRLVAFRSAGDAVQLTCADFATPAHTGISMPTQVQAGSYIATQIILPGETPQPGTSRGVAGVPSPQAAGSMFTLQVRAVDQFFNRVPGVNNPLTIISVDANLVVPGSVVLQDGEVSIPTTIFAAGMQTLSATDQTSGAINAPISSSFNVSAGAYAKLLVLAPGETALPGAPNGRVGTATDQSITFEFTLTAMSVDSWYNQVFGITDVVHLASTDAGASLPADQALVNGMAQLPVRLATGGFQQITLSSVGTPGVASSTTQVRAISSGLHLRASIAEAVVQAGVPFTLRVSVVNDAGSVIQEINDAVQVVARHADTQNPGAGTLSSSQFQLIQGRRTVSLSYTFAEPIVLEVSSTGGTTPGLTGVLTVEPAAPHNLTVTSNPGWVRANRTAVVSATLSDAFGNPVPGRTVTFATTADDSGSLGDHGMGDKSVAVQTDAGGLALVDYHSPRWAQTVQLTVSSGSLLTGYLLQTALVDPATAGGYLTSYPNPFHPAETPTTIAYVLDDDATVRLRVYTLSGGLVLDQQYPSGAAGGQTGLNEIQWDGRNGAGEPVASGGYVVYVEAAGNGATQHVMRRKIGVVW